MCLRQDMISSCVSALVPDHCPLFYSVLLGRYKEFTKLFLCVKVPKRLGDVSKDNGQHLISPSQSLSQTADVSK